VRRANGLIVIQGAHLIGFRTPLLKHLAQISSRQLLRTVPGAVRRTVRRTVCRLVEVSSEEHLQELFAGPSHMCQKIRASRSIRVIPHDHRLDSPKRNLGQSSCPPKRLLSTIRQLVQVNPVNCPSENSVLGPELFKEAASSRCVISGVKKKLYWRCTSTRTPSEPAKKPCPWVCDPSI